jgi:predicted component of type VI protein secretion system
MKQIPAIIVRLIHIDGPLKGQEQEFSDFQITVGRHPSCHVQFPKDATTISRKHAFIIRDGNTFKIVDQSTNGTFVNGKRVQEEALVKNGDVLMFANGGPKVAFLTASLTQPVEAAPTPQAAPTEANHVPDAEAPPESPETPLQPQQHVEPHPEPVDAAPKLDPEPEPIQKHEAIRVERSAIPLNIQYGPFLKSFKELPVVIGSSDDCHFKIEHPDIYDRHLQVFFHEGAYCVQDLTGKKLVSINGFPIEYYGKLTPDCQLSLIPGGPAFRFIASGSLAEMEPAAVEEDAGEESEYLFPDGKDGVEKNKEQQSKPKKHSLFKKFFG